MADLADELVSQRAASRIGERVQVLIEEAAAEGVVGRAAHQGPEVDGNVYVTTSDRLDRDDLVEAVVSGSDGVDLLAAVTANQLAVSAARQELRSP